MVKLKAVKEFLESLVPLYYQDSWDNSGLQFGDEEKEISKVGFALSPSIAVIEEAKNAEIDLLITHHPLTISGVKRFTFSTYPSNLLIRLIRSDIALYALHTNLDVSPLGPTAVIADLLGVEIESSIVENPPYGAVGTLKMEATQAELLKRLTSVLPKDVFRTVNFNGEKPVRKVAICSGSGASFIDLVAGKVDLYITGDVKYHDAMKAVDLELTLFDMGHFGTERLFYIKLKEKLAKAFPELELITLDEKSPFEVVRDA